MVTTTAVDSSKNGSKNLKRILVVDDESDIKLALMITLEENGFEVDAFDDPAIALDSFRKGVYMIY